MSNRKLKIALFNKDPHCHWCKKVTKLVCEPSLKCNDPLMATIDHVVSRYNIRRWVKKKRGDVRKVLACYECNYNRSINETLGLSRAEILQRSKGFSYSPRGKPKITKPLVSVDEVLAKLNVGGKL